ncbi:MAG: Double zinc ribbon [Candidatus Methanofastidiosum methylothiophilum]|uniref:Double zinc ribbon n=1 Tax=Candidatus Methanofastidiosum methylothiophilum TaxID=1705564 RepID=A0A150II63_9EURY|nr:MAG: Double zinc ribbon [Candidatus Methanofastidiosum methylthiophilus]KYC46719.1 MAG: Double zinc ribbon [Candidatus Methanofastidiosum methylthiophilus]KYC49950.1 MAG: Double zinc ribbon [Candidatus Methanofastidiosum methylthiophilus]
MPSLKCPKCAEKIEKEWLKCPHCNTALKISCKKCGQELKEEWVSCPNCGKKKVNYEKIKLQALVGIAIVIIGIILSNVVYLDYPFTETYIDREPYTETETYIDNEPYTVFKPITKTEKYVICGESEYPLSNKSAYSDCLIEGNYRSVSPLFYFPSPDIIPYPHSITNTSLPGKYWPESDNFLEDYYWHSIKVDPSLRKISYFSGTGVVDRSIPRDQCTCTIKEKTVTVNERTTEYKDVTKTRTLTKYKDVKKTRTVTKKVKMLDLIFGNV